MYITKVRLETGIANHSAKNLPWQRQVQLPVTAVDIGLQLHKHGILNKQKHIARSHALRQILHR